MIGIMSLPSAADSYPECSTNANTQREILCHVVRARADRNANRGTDGNKHSELASGPHPAPFVDRPRDTAASAALPVGYAGHKKGLCIQAFSGGPSWVRTRDLMLIKHAL
jgi:hypothetical protein